MMGITRPKALAATAALLLLLAATTGHAVTINTFADVTVTHNANVSVATDNYTATSGSITSDLLANLGSNNLPTDSGNASAMSDVGKIMYASAGSRGWSSGYYEQFHARADWSGTITYGGSIYLHIYPGFLGLQYLPLASAEYSFDIWNNGNLVWSSAASAANTGNGIAFATSGYDLGGTVSDDGSFFSYSFSDNYNVPVHVLAGTLTYVMETRTANSGNAHIGDPFHGFETDFVPDAPPSVPEPATALLLGAGLLGMAGPRKRRKQ